MPVPNYVQYSVNGNINTTINGAAPFAVTFVNTSSTPSYGTTLTWLWDFGDGNTSTLENPGVHTYTTGGTFVPTLTETFSANPPVDSTGNTSTVIVTASPVVVLPNYVELPVQKLTADQYGAIGTKNITAAFPYKFYENGNYPLRTVTVWPIPNRCHLVKLWLWQPLINAVDLDTDMQFPQGYERALRFALAVELAAEFGKEVPANVRSIAKMAKATVKRLNSTPQILKGDIAIASDQNNMFNYITGDTIPTNM